MFVLLASVACSDKKPPEEVKTYTNPLKLQLADGNVAETCPDPAIIHSQTPGDDAWYLYCTSNPLNNQMDAAGKPVFHLLPIYSSKDLVDWAYVGDAFDSQPAWAAAPQGFWAPDIQFFNGKYYLYYTASDTKVGGSAIGVATSDSPAGPWTQAPAPVVEPQKPPCCVNDPNETRRRWVFDSNVVTGDDGQRYLYFGSYFGGIAIRKLSADGLSTDAASQKEIISDDIYEGAYIVKHDNYYYFFGSATNCCNGPLTGYSVFAGRSTSPMGPYVDRDGNPLTQGRVGGTPVISMNGNRWVGPGHNSVFTDFANQDWIVYHAIDRNDPYRLGKPQGDFSDKRHVLMDPLDWVDGWPTVRGGLWASDEPIPAPAAQPKQKAHYTMTQQQPDEAGALMATFSDDFTGPALGSQWTWVRPPATTTYGLESGTLRFDAQEGDLYKEINTASVLTAAAPQGKNYIVETKVRMNVPAQGCCFNYTQAGLVIYGDDDNFIKLTPFALWNTRQIEFAKEQFPVPQDFPRYGNTVAGPPGEDTWLRIAVRFVDGGETYTAYTSRDGTQWYRNGTWTHKLGNARIGLVSMARASDHPEFTAHFDYVHVYELNN
ncbi:MAG: family 43 glycosylhydrolase [Hyalangium sp.]|uniref:family 43 glycosylhydrolase n=1 Tax=Hyalangium sp. TaxID=2028555 RepID=UPI00389ABFF0